MSHHKSRQPVKQSVTVIELINAHYRTVIVHLSYCLSDKSQHYDDCVESRTAKNGWRLDIQLNAQMLNCTDRIIFGFLPTLQMASNENGIHEGATMYLFYFFTKSADAALNTRTCISRSICLRQEEKLTSYSEVVNPFLAMLTADDTIAEGNMENMNLIQHTGQKAGQCGQQLCRRTYTAAP